MQVTLFVTIIFCHYIFINQTISKPIIFLQNKSQNHFSPNLNKRELFISKMTTLWIVINFEKRGNYDKITEYQNIEISSSVKRAFKLQNFAKLLWNRGYELVYDKSRSLTAIEIVKIRGGKKNRGRIQIGGLSCTR